MATSFVPPDLDKDSFHCPHCSVFTRQYGGHLSSNRGAAYQKEPYIHNISVVKHCENCGEETIWINDVQIYPRPSPAPKPHPDMPDEISRDFSEARNVLNDSPRAAAALLRLSLEKLMDELDATGNTLYTQIGDLVENGTIDPKIQQACDSIRVLGNESVHSGEIVDMTDGREASSTLFDMINLIVDETISRKKNVEEFYSDLPEGKRQGIENRDST